jgi:hypothetical protein
MNEYGYGDTKAYYTKSPFHFNRNIPCSPYVGDALSPLTPYSIFFFLAFVESKTYEKYLIFTSESTLIMLNIISAIYV